MIKIAHVLYRSDPEQAETYASRALILAETLGFKKGSAECNLIIGTSHWVRGNYDKALGYFAQSLTTCNEIGDSKGAASCYSNIGLVHRHRGDYEQALACYLKALKIKEELGDTSGIAKAYNNIGIIYDEQGDTSHALDYYRKALHLFEELGDKQGIAFSYNNVGVIYEARGDLVMAMEHYHRSLAIKQELGDTKGIASSYMNIGTLCEEQKEYDSALAHCSEALRIFEEIQDRRGIADANNHIGRIQTRLGRYESAHTFLQKGLTLAQEIGAKDWETDCYQYFSELHEAEGDFEQAFAYHRQYSELREKIFCDATAEKIANMQVRYETEKKEKETEIYRGIFENTVIGMYRMTPEGRILMANSALVVMLGYSSFPEVTQHDFRVERHDARHSREDFLDRLARDGVVRGWETVWSRRDGTSLPVRESARALHDEAGNLLFYEGTIEDITQQKRTEEALREEKKYVDAALAAQLDTFFLFDPATGKALRWNRVFREISGYADEEIARMPAPASYYSPEDLKRAGRFLQKVLKEGTGTIELELICKNGTKVPTEYRVSVINDARGKPKYIISIGRDVTERKRADEALREERDKAQKYLDIAGVMFVALNENGEVSLINRKGCEILGYEHEEVIGKNWFDTFLPIGAREQTKTVFHKLMSGATEPVEYNENPVLTKRGEERTIAWHNTTLRDDEGRIIGTLASGEDITERKRAEEALKESEEKFRILVQHQGEGIATVDEDEFFTFANPAAERKFGTTPGSLVGRNLAEFVDEETFRFLREQTESRKRGESHVYDVEIIRPDGEKRQLVVTATPKFADDGTFISTFGVFRDMTDYLKTEEALRQSEERLRSTIASMDDLIFVIDEAGVFVEYYQPPEMPDLFAPPERFLGGSFKEVMPLHVAELTRTALSAVKATGAPQRFDYPLRIAEKERWFSTTMSVRRDSIGKFAGVTVVCRDITDRKLAEKAVHTSRQKVEDLHGIARRLMGCHEENDVYNLTVDGASEIVDFSSCVLYVAEGTKLVPKAMKPPSYFQTCGEQGLHMEMAQKTLQTQKTSVFGCPSEIPVKKKPRGVAQSGISAPIADLGVFQVCSSESHAFTADDARLLELLLGHVAEGVRRIRLERALRDQAIHDSLTGVYNRHYLAQALKQETKRSKRHGRPLDVLMIDIDRLKEINDRFGHQTGDKVLQKVAAVLQEQTRETDAIIRYGGDEFLILLSEAQTEPEALETRLSQSIAHEIAADRLVDFPVTLSIGRARWKPDGKDSVEATLAEADRRMYDSKRTRLVIDEERD